MGLPRTAAVTVEAGAVLGGFDPVIAAVAGRLETSVPAELDRLEVAYGRPVRLPGHGEEDLWRPPGLYARADRAVLEPDDYPAVLVVAQHTDPAEVVDLVDGAVVWRIPYVLRVWVMCRHYGGQGEEVAACRNRLALAVLQALFRAPRLSATMAVSLAGWRQSWSDVGVDDLDQSTVAGYWVELTVDATESVTGDTVARADTVTVVVHPEAD